MTQSDAARAWELMKKIGFCMLSSREGQKIRTRPMTAHVEPDEHAVYFLTDIRNHKDDEIREDPNVSLAFADTSSQNYVAVTGRAVISNDRDRIRELWSTPAQAWWDSPEDPDIRVLRVVPEDAQFWDGPGRIGGAVKILAAALTGSKPDLGDQAKVKL